MYPQISVCRLIWRIISDFQAFPRSVNSTLGDTVDFYCRPYFTGYHISWLINGTELCQFNNASGVSELSETSLRIHSVQQQFNNTFVHCKISTTSIISPPALLLIQGNYECVCIAHTSKKERSKIKELPPPPLSSLLMHNTHCTNCTHHYSLCRGARSCGRPPRCSL